MALDFCPYYCKNHSRSGIVVLGLILNKTSMTRSTVSHLWRPQVSYSCFSCNIFSDCKYRIIALRCTIFSGRRYRISALAVHLWWPQISYTLAVQSLVTAKIVYLCCTIFSDRKYCKAALAVQSLVAAKIA